jgi:hypothetical protein
MYHIEQEEHPELAGVEKFKDQMRNTLLQKMHVRID